MAGPTTDFWQQRFEKNEIGWDRGSPGPQLLAWLDSGELKTCRIAVPGCGSGWEVVELAKRGFDVTGIDYTAAAVERSRALLHAQRLSAQVIQADVLSFQPEKKFDAIYEQTCLCAIHPEHMSYGRMQTAEVELKAQITALVQKATNTDEAEKNEPDLDIPAEIERRTARLAAIVAAKARLEERQRQTDAQRGRTPEDERKPKDKDGKPNGGRPYQRDFGVPPAKAQDSFTDPESRIMKRAGGGFDYAFNAQTAVDETAHIIVAAEVVNTSSDVQQLPMVLGAVKAHTGEQADQVLADAGYRSEAVMAELAITQPDTELVIALGREGKVLAKPRDAQRYPHTVAMAAKFETEQGKLDYRKRKWIAEPPNGWIKNVLGFRQFSMRGLKKAQAEFKLVCLALNLRRMGAMQAS